MSTSKHRRKWVRFEREIAQRFARAGYPAHRCLQFQRDHGSPDVLADPFWVECKSGAHPTIGPAYDLALGNAPYDKHALVVSKSEAGHRLVTLSLAEFLAWVQP